MTNRHQGDGRFEVVAGGLLCAAPCLLMIDIDARTQPSRRRLVPFAASAGASAADCDAADGGTPESRPTLFRAEAHLLKDVERRGVELLVPTAADPGLTTALLEDWHIHAAVLPDGPAASRAERSQIRLSHVARACRRRGHALSELAVIAMHPEDGAIMLEAGTAFALRGAGYDAETAADAVFPERHAGGLVFALQVVIERCRLRRRPAGRG